MDGEIVVVSTLILGTSWWVVLGIDPHVVLHRMARTQSGKAHKASNDVTMNIEQAIEQSHPEDPKDSSHSVSPDSGQVPVPRSLNEAWKR